MSLLENNITQAAARRLGMGVPPKRKGASNDLGSFYGVLRGYHFSHAAVSLHAYNGALGEDKMRIGPKSVLPLIIGAAIGGLAVQGIHAQSALPIYLIEEIEVSNLDAYLREYAVKSLAHVNASGGRRLALGIGKVTQIEGDPPKPRIVILRWDNMEKMQAWLNSPENKALRKIGDQYAKFRIFAVEGLAQP